MESTLPLPPEPGPDATLGAEYDGYVMAAYTLVAFVMLFLTVSGYLRRAKARAKLERWK